MSLLGAGIAALGSVAGSLIGAHSQSQANEANVKLWREQAAYNTPANQVKRLREAGLNPNLFYSQGDPGNMSSAPTMKASDYNFDFSSFQLEEMQREQRRNLREQNLNMREQNRKLKAETKAQELQNKIRQKELDIIERTGMRPGVGATLYDIGDKVYSTLTGGKHLPDTAQDIYDMATGVPEIAHTYVRRDSGMHDSTINTPPEKMSRKTIMYMVDNGYVFDRNRGKWVVFDN